MMGYHADEIVEDRTHKQADTSKENTEAKTCLGLKKVNMVDDAVHLLTLM